MKQVGLEIGGVECRNVRVGEEDAILGIVLLGVRGEVERAGNDKGGVNDHNLVVSNGVHGVYEGGKTLVAEESKLGVLEAGIAAVENEGDLDGAAGGLDKGGGNEGGSEEVGLNENGSAGNGEGGDDGTLSAAEGREVDGDTGEHGGGHNPKDYVG